MYYQQTVRDEQPWLAGHDVDTTQLQKPDDRFFWIQAIPLIVGLETCRVDGEGEADASQVILTRKRF